MSAWVKQHLSNTLGPMHEKVEQQQGRDEKIPHIKKRVQYSIL